MTHLIDKSALVAELQRLSNEWRLLSSAEAKYRREVYTELLSFINTLEVKEVDLDFQHFAKEMAEVYALPTSITKNTEDEPLNWEYAIAKHFFELGLKAKQE